MKQSVLLFLGLLILLKNYDRSNCMRLRVTPGIPCIRWFDKKYLDDIHVQTRRNGRKGQYVINLNFTNKYNAGNNVSFHFYYKQLLANEYRPSFVEAHFRLCDLILKDPFIGSIFRNAGMSTCPIPPGQYYFGNMSFDQEFPSVWPFENGQCELIARTEPSGREIGRGDLTLTFKMIYN